MHKKEKNHGEFISPEIEVDSVSVIKKSKFIASVRRITHVKNAPFILRAIESLYPSATHYCWAYRFSGELFEEHYSDAGEPSGTAGRPILSAIKKSGITRGLVIVTRYYGGIKLGVRGLIDAYHVSAVNALNLSGKIAVPLTVALQFNLSYPSSAAFLGYLGYLGIPETSISLSYLDKVSGLARIPLDLEHNIQDFISSRLKLDQGDQFSWEKRDEL